jgi:hypothetical protein
MLPPQVLLFTCYVREIHFSCVLFLSTVVDDESMELQESLAVQQVDEMLTVIQYSNPIQASPVFYFTLHLIFPFPPLRGELQLHLLSPKGLKLTRVAVAASVASVCVEILYTVYTV